MVLAIRWCARLTSPPSGHLGRRRRRRQRCFVGVPRQVSSPVAQPDSEPARRVCLRRRRPHHAPSPDGPRRGADYAQCGDAERYGNFDILLGEWSLRFGSICRVHRLRLGIFLRNCCFVKPFMAKFPKMTISHGDLKRDSNPRARRVAFPT